MKRRLNLCVAASLAACLASTIAVHAEADVVTFDLNHNFGAVNAGGNVLVTITDASGNVTIAVTNNSAGYIKDLFLNYSPSADLTAGATIANFSDGSWDVSQPTVGYNAQGFAIDFGYQAANNNPGRFGPTETVTFELDAAAALTAGGFNNLGGGPAGDDYYAAAHVIAITATGTCTAGSAKVGDTNGGNVGGGGNVTNCGDLRLTQLSVPEPATFALLGLGLAGLGWSHRKNPTISLRRVA